MWERYEILIDLIFEIRLIHNFLKFDFLIYFLGHSTAGNMRLHLKKCRTYVNHPQMVQN